MGMKWEIDDKNTVNIKAGFGGARVFLNDRQVGKVPGFSSDRSVSFPLSDGSPAKLSLKGKLAPSYELTVGDKLIIPTLKGLQMVCAQCKSECKPNDAFCNRCGNQLPTSDVLDRQIKIKHAQTTIKVLAGMFLVFGIFIFLTQMSTYENAFKNVEQYGPQDKIPGTEFTGESIRKQLTYEKYGVLGLNVFLALLMFGLSFWANSSPLGALIVATAIYLALQVYNAIIDPLTIGQGIWVKIIIITYLVKGIRSVLELKPANANRNVPKL